MEQTAIGAEIIARRPSPSYANCEIVLCLWNHQFVTWIMRTDTGDCTTGHYFHDDIVAAAEDFRDRY